MATTLFLFAADVVAITTTALMGIAYLVTGRRVAPWAPDADGPAKGFARASAPASPPAWLLDRQRQSLGSTAE